MIISFLHPSGLLHFTLQDSLRAGFSYEGCNSALQDFLPSVASQSDWWQLPCLTELLFASKRGDPKTYQHSSLHHPTSLYFHGFPWRWSDLRGLGSVVFGVTSWEAWITCDITDFFWKHEPTRCAKPTSQSALQSPFVLCQQLGHQPLVPAACSGSDTVLEQGLGTVCGNGCKLMAPLPKMWNHFFRLPAVTALSLGGHVVMSGQQFSHVLNVFKIFNVSIWVFFRGINCSNLKSLCHSNGLLMEEAFKKNLCIVLRPDRDLATRYNMYQYLSYTVKFRLQINYNRVCVFMYCVLLSKLRELNK